MVQNGTENPVLTREGVIQAVEAAYETDDHLLHFDIDKARQVITDSLITGHPPNGVEYFILGRGLKDMSFDLEAAKRFCLYSFDQRTTRIKTAGI